MQETLQDAFARAGFKTTAASKEFLAWLGLGKAAPETIALMAAGVPQRQKRRGRLGDRWDLFTEDEIRKEAEEFPRYLKAGLLSIGSCINGDPVALDVRKQVGAVGYISHDEVWGDEEARIRKFFVVVAPSLAEFVRRASEGSLPVDYWAAKGQKC